jgi:hypothetical protein
MRRPVLITVAVLGVLIAVIGSTGLFAALTDTARTGTNTVDSASLAASADIRLAAATRNYPDPVVCGTFSENLATGFFSISDVGPDYPGTAAYYCIKNVGSQTLNLWATADELADVDTNCTGDEGLSGDATCGGDALGELSSVLYTGHTKYNDCSGLAGSGFSIKLHDHAAQFNAFSGTIAPGDVWCFQADITYKSDAPAADIQKAQSDRVTWRYKFRADVAP